MSVNVVSRSPFLEVILGHVSTHRCVKSLFQLVLADFSAQQYPKSRISLHIFIEYESKIMHERNEAIVKQWLTQHNV